MHQTWSERERGNGEQSSRGVGRVGTMAAVNSRDKNRLEKRSSRRAWCTFGRHFLSSASARCAVAHVRLRWRRRRRLVAVGENFLFSSLAWQLGRRKGVFTCSTTRKENEKLDRENTEPSEANVFLMCWKMRWTTTSEQHSVTSSGWKFLRKARTKKKRHCSSACSINSSTFAPAEQELALTNHAETTAAIKKKKKKKEKQPFSSPSNTKLNGPQSRSILGGHPIANSVPGYYGQRVTRKESIGNSVCNTVNSAFEVHVCQNFTHWISTGVGMCGVPRTAGANNKCRLSEIFEFRSMHELNRKNHCLRLFPVVSQG